MKNIYFHFKMISHAMRTAASVYGKKVTQFCILDAHVNARWKGGTMSHPGVRARLTEQTNCLVWGAD